MAKYLRFYDDVNCNGIEVFNLWQPVVYQSLNIQDSPTPIPSNNKIRSFKYNLIPEGTILELWADKSVRNNGVWTRYIFGANSSGDQRKWNNVEVNQNATGVTFFKKGSDRLVSNISHIRTVPAGNPAQAYMAWEKGYNWDQRNGTATEWVNNGKGYRLYQPTIQPTDLSAFGVTQPFVSAITQDVLNQCNAALQRVTLAVVIDQFNLGAGVSDNSANIYLTFDADGIVESLIVNSIVVLNSGVAVIQPLGIDRFTDTKAATIYADPLLSTNPKGKNDQLADRFSDRMQELIQNEVDGLAMRDVLRDFAIDIKKATRELMQIVGKATTVGAVALPA